MATIVKQIEVSKELYELGEGITNFLVQLKEAGRDGFNAADISLILESAIMDIIPAMNGAERIMTEFEEDKAAFTNAAILIITGMLEALAE